MFPNPFVWRKYLEGYTVLRCHHYFYKSCPKRAGIYHMRLFFFIAVFFCLQTSLHAQFNLMSGPAPEESFSAFEKDNFSFFKKKLRQRNHGVIVGVQRGRSTAIELGGEAHWRKISLKDPQIIGATANMEYDFSQHMVGYKAGMWMKRGRVNFTYGGNIGYHTDFKGRNIYTAGPAIGFRLLGLHLINGYNFQVGDTEVDKDGGTGVNMLYMSLRYYFPLENKFVWDGNRKKQNQKARAKKERLKEKEAKKRAREKQKEGTPKKKLLGIEF